MDQDVIQSHLGSWFRQRNTHKWSWLSRDHHTKKEIDHIITRSQHRLLFKNYCVLRNAEFPANSDHLLVTVKADPAIQEVTHITLNEVIRCSASACWSSATAATLSGCRESFHWGFSTLGTLPDDPEECWQSVRTVMREAADRIVGSRQHKRQRWLSDKAHDIVTEKSAARKRSDHTERRWLQNV